MVRNVILHLLELGPSFAPSIMLSNRIIRSSETNLDEAVYRLLLQLRNSIIVQTAAECYCTTRRSRNLASLWLC